VGKSLHTIEIKRGPLREEKSIGKSRLNCIARTQLGKKDGVCLVELVGEKGGGPDKEGQRNCIQRKMARGGGRGKKTQKSPLDYLIQPY